MPDGGLNLTPIRMPDGGLNLTPIRMPDGGLNRTVESNQSIFDVHLFLLCVFSSLSFSLLLRPLRNIL
jgi:hypothetical protein